MRKKMIVGIAVFSIFIFLIMALVFVYAFFPSRETVPEAFLPFWDYHELLMVLIGGLGVATGLIYYAVINPGAKNQKPGKSRLGIISRMLNEEERRTLDFLLGKQGTATQCDISRLPGMSRLKAHRTVRKLEDWAIVRVEKQGKIRVVRIADGI